jgi:hypothetical protein
LPNRGETRDISHFQCSGQRSDRSHSRDRPEPFDSLGQQRVPLQGADQGILARSHL